jgi:AraC-like DNA-binding protein
VEENHRAPQWQIDRIDRPYSVIWYVFSGEKSVEIGGAIYHVTQGDLAVFPAQVPFAVFPNDKDIPLHHIDFAIENKLGPFDFLTLYQFPVVIKAEPSRLESLLPLWAQIKDLWTPDNIHAYSKPLNEMTLDLQAAAVSLRFGALVNQWLAELLYLLQPYSAEAYPSFDGRLQQVLLYIEDHLSDKISLKRLAKEVFLSESHLSLLFRQKLNISPIEYVRQARLHKARDLLLTTDYRVKEIAEMVGFGEQSQLSRAFRDEVGVSPLRYRTGEGL